MKISTRLVLLVAAALVALFSVGGYALTTLKHTMLDERRAQITNLLQMAQHLADYYHDQEVAGTLTREQAQASVKQALTQLNYSDKSFFWARTPEGITLIHRNQALIGKNNAGKALDGRSDGDVFREALARDPMPIMAVQARQPSTGVMTDKLNGLIEFKPWNWWIGTGIFIDDINKTFWETAGFLIGLIVVAAGVIGALSWQIIRNVVGALGGEPAYAAKVTQRIATGDLTERIVVQAGDQQSLLASIAKMQTSLVDMINRIRAGSEAVTVGTNEIASGNNDLSSRTEEQAASLQETAASMEQLTATVQQNSENAQRANQFAANASSTAQNGGVVVARVVEAMNAISASSGKMADITATIESIAFQTNILALNAAVEAARAGEEGRGFAVVASEVRSLAQRSSLAAKEIKSLIEDSIDQVREGSNQVSAAGRTMSEIVSAVGDVTEIMSGISTASVEQRSGIEQVNQAVAQMDQVTQQNAALVEEAAAAAGSLADQAERLSATVSVFRV
ncbi:methyl-accepting chemotaxis protein [Robbsia sp. Bb-Pol-6]|uniref:Methyl-accepting chemotaxis protein n=1 Tax=Robbsia betulipollinis TaxID=2981849 RepID=A0ABT3ZJP0_9BURK|nr:methyl-accepting chemotaxis protein [Robbsia betulipollinis]MCY0386180.1 methyl-accepting chemotaxis protein [Robbsia betulipollinis]